jgi:hypothetical protein
MTPQELENLELGFLCGAVCGWVLYYVGAAAWILTGEWLARHRARRRGHDW